MFERFTDRARKVMALANQEAQRFQHEYIGTEHLLLGLVKEGAGVAANVLRNLGLDLRTVRIEVEKLTKCGPEPLVTMGKLPQTPRAKKVIEYAIEEVRNLGHAHVGTEHILLGLLRIPEGVAAQVLTSMGLTLDQVRDEVIKLTGPDINADDAEKAKEAEQSADQLIQQAADAGASDIHLDSTRDGRGRVRFRIDGVLRDVDLPGNVAFNEVLGRMKYMANLQTDDHASPQIGQILLKLSGKDLDLRISVVPTHYGERLVARLLDRQQIKISLSDLRLADEDFENIRQLCRLPQGVVVVNGATGSGKTTTLYAMLLEANSPGTCVITVEDPVEYAFDDIAQIQLNPSTGLTFARAIYNIMRQDPDVIMVGEIRELETAELIMQCALTGHLVFTTLHANTGPGAIRRLIDIGIEPYVVNSALAAVVSQRLVRILCDKCKQPAEPATHSMPPEAVEFVANCQEANFCRPVGCEECRSTGYRVRTAVQEILIMSDPIRQAIADGADMGAIRRTAIESGMKTMLQSGLEKAAKGITSIEEVLRVVPPGVS